MIMCPLCSVGQDGESVSPLSDLLLLRKTILRPLELPEDEEEDDLRDRIGRSSWLPCCVAIDTNK